MGLQDKFGRKSGLLAIMLSRSTVDVVRATGLGLYERVILIFRETWKGISVIIECSRGHFILVNLKQSLYLDERKKGRESVGKCVLKIVFFFPNSFFYSTILPHWCFPLLQNFSKVDYSLLKQLQFRLSPPLLHETRLDKVTKGLQIAKCIGQFIVLILLYPLDIFDSGWSCFSPWNTFRISPLLVSYYLSFSVLTSLLGCLIGTLNMSQTKLLISTIQMCSFCISVNA